MKTKNAKEILANLVGKLGVELSVVSITKYLSEDGKSKRHAGPEIAKAIAHITKTDIDMWRNPERVSERVAAFELFAESVNGNFYQGRGRPSLKKENQCHSYTNTQ